MLFAEPGNRALLPQLWVSDLVDRQRCSNSGAELFIRRYAAFTVQPDSIW
jgi:hypothetical protein